MLTDEMKAILNSKERHIAVTAFAGCVDKDTEFFTGKEWKKISEYKEGGMVLQFNKDWTAELVKPKQYIKKPCDIMNGIVSKYGVDMVLSDEHRVIYVDTSHGKKEFGEHNILETTCKDMVSKQIKNKSGFTGKFITTFKLKDNNYKYFLSDDEIKLYMAVLSDGNISNERTKYVIMHLKKQRKKDRLVSILNNLNIKYVEYHTKDGYTSYRFHFDKATKEFDFGLLKMSEHDRRVLFDEIPYWDGYYEKFKRSGNVVFFTSIKHNADFIQMLGATLNKRGFIKHDNRIGEKMIATNGTAYIRKSCYYQVNFTDRIFTSIGFHSKPNNRFNNIYSYKTLDGYKYCFTVDSGMLVLRRNNRIFITGNSGKSSTMLEYIKQRPNEKILFLVYNKEMQRDFSNRVKSIRHSAKISTIHSFAFRWFISKYGKRNFKNISAIDIKKVLKNRRLTFRDLCLIKFYYDMYLCSDKDTPYELELISKEDNRLMKYVDQLFEYYSKYSDTIQHNVYLKMYQLSKEKIVGYDTIILDEANDSNSCMLSIIINNLDKKVIVVGDPLQNLNSFNYTVDGLSILIDKYNFKEYKLTKSFRVSEEVANLSSRYLSYMYDKKIQFSGIKDTKFVHMSFKDSSPQNQITLLCRNRLGGLIEAMDILRMYPNKNIYYAGGLDSFGLGEIEKLIAYKGTVYIGGEKFHISELRKMLDDDDVQDPEVRRIVGLYNFGNNIENRMLFPLLRKTETTNREDADIVIQTAHSSKGLTVKNVYLARDFAPIEDIKKEMLDMKLNGTEYMYNVSKSEVNLIYVALTRATDYIDMNDVLFKKDRQRNRITVEMDNKKISNKKERC